MWENISSWVSKMTQDFKQNLLSLVHFVGANGEQKDSDTGTILAHPRSLGSALTPGGPS